MPSATDQGEYLVSLWSAVGNAIARQPEINLLQVRGATARARATRNAGGLGRLPEKARLTSLVRRRPTLSHVFSLSWRQGSEPPQDQAPQRFRTPGHQTHAPSRRHAPRRTDLYPKKTRCGSRATRLGLCWRVRTGSPRLRSQDLASSVLPLPTRLQAGRQATAPLSATRARPRAQW